jgi:ATP-dependent DNA ligase
MAVFDALHSRVNDAKASACAFDLMMLNGEDLRRKQYVERKAALRKLLRHGRAEPRNIIPGSQFLVRARHTRST